MFVIKNKSHSTGTYLDQNNEFHWLEGNTSIKVKEAPKSVSWGLTFYEKTEEPKPSEDDKDQLNANKSGSHSNKD